jgi:hypothetical protein
MSENKSNGFLFLLLGLLTICFVVLKLIGAIAWSWLWVLSPLWCPLSVVLVWAIIMAMIITIIGD